MLPEIDAIPDQEGKTPDKINLKNGVVSMGINTTPFASNEV